MFFNSLFLGDMNVDMLASESVQNAQNRVEIGCEDISLNPAQMPALM